MITVSSIILVTSLAAALGGEPTPAAGAGASALPSFNASPVEAEKAYTERYRTIVERNIFSRERPRRLQLTFAKAEKLAQEQREREERRLRRGEREEAAEGPEKSLIVTGVVLRDGVYTAFIEDARTGATTRARVGDRVALGKISEIRLGVVAYEAAGSRSEIEVGKSLTGASPNFPASASPPAEARAPALPAREGRGTRGGGARNGRGGRDSMIPRDPRAAGGSAEPPDLADSAEESDARDAAKESIKDSKDGKDSKGAPAAAPASASGSSSEESILERLRKRRLEEDKK